MLNWFALYTRPRFEKKVDIRLREKGFESWLPLKKEVRQWKDRRKTVEEPLFRSYVFIRTEEKQLSEASRTDGIAAPVRFNGRPARVADEEIRAIETILGGPEEWEIGDLAYARGEKVKVIHGPLAGISGTWVEWRGSKKMAITIESIGKSILVEIPAPYIEKA